MSVAHLEPLLLVSPEPITYIILLRSKDYWQYSLYTDSRDALFRLRELEEREWKPEFQSTQHIQAAIVNCIIRTRKSFWRPDLHLYPSDDYLDKEDLLRLPLDNPEDLDRARVLLDL